MKLLEFPHSHYCEKARWALDYKGLPFEAVAIMPGLHLHTVRKIAPGTSVPVLIDGDKVVQGSGKIIDYLDRRHDFPPLLPTSPEKRQMCLELERVMDIRLGEPLRQILYYRLLAYPGFIRKCFTHPMPWYKRLAFALMYPVLKRKIYQTYVISPEAVAQARRDFAQTMDELAERLQGRRFLVGDVFSRVDLTVASMLSLLVMPTEHPFPWGDIPDEETRAFCESYRNHPVSEWVRRVYREHRQRPATQ